jgi:mono/diheme cytochrome c family protein
VRRVTLVLAALACTVGLSGCGSRGTTKPLPETVVGSIPKASEGPKAPAAALKGDPTAGKQIFMSAGCASCHTLSDAGATGTIGPNLDDAKPDFQLATTRVTFGQGQMPSFKDQLSAQQIADVAGYVVQATGGTPP